MKTGAQGGRRLGGVRERAGTLPADAKAWLGTYRTDNERQFVQDTAGGAPTGAYSVAATAREHRLERLR